MTFLAPGALIGLLLLAIPIVVHLLRPRRMRPTAFSSLRWLRETPQRASRRIQWHQWPLFMLRASIITLLVVALAKPLLDFSRDRQGINRVVVLDASSSMGRGDGRQPTPLAQAIEQVRKIAANNRASDRLTILAVGGESRVLLPATRGPEHQIVALASVVPDAASADLAGVLPLVRMLLDEEDADRPREVIFVTDNLQQRWNQGDIQAFAAERSNKLAVQVIDVSPQQRANAWIADARQLSAGDGLDHSLQVIVRSVGNQPLPRNLRWTMGVGPGEQFSVTRFGAGVGIVQIPLPNNQQKSQAAGELRLEPGDAYSADDRYFVSLVSRPAQRALIVEPESGVAGRRSGTHWREALTALASAGRVIEVVERTTRAVTAEDVRHADFVLLAGVAELDDAIVSELEKRVRAGIGLVVCLGPTIQRDFYNRKLHRALQPDEGLLPVALAARDKASGSDAPALLTRLDWQHPLLAPLADPVQSDFADSQFFNFSQIAGEVGPRDAILARFDNGSPAIIEHPLGLGRVFLLNTSADDAWADLPRRKCFVPFVDRLIAYLAPGTRGQAELRTGEPITLRLPPEISADKAQVIGPNGEAVEFEIINVANNHAVRVERAKKPGIYRLKVQEKTVASVAVQSDRADSALISSDTEALRQWWSPAEFELVSTEAASASAAASSAWPIWPWLVLAAGLLLVGEQLYVTRLCPRAAPSAPLLIVRATSSNSKP